MMENWRKKIHIFVAVVLLTGVSYLIIYTLKLDVIVSSVRMHTKHSNTVEYNKRNVTKYRWNEVRNKYSYDQQECEAILSHNKSSIKKANQYQRDHRELYMQSSRIYFWLLNATNDCDYFKQQKGYWTHKVTTEEAKFSIAYSILVYTNTDQVERLLRAIYRPSNVYCLHVDRKGRPSMRHSLHLISKCFPNVFMSTKSEYVKWGRASVVRAELNCWRDLLKFPKKWKYLLNLTGQEFPLKTNYQIVKALKALNGTNNIQFGNQKFILRQTRKFPVKPPYNITVYKGSTHMAMSRGFVDFVINSPFSAEWFNWCFQQKIPDERCFSSLNFNPHLGVPGSFIGNPYEIPKDWWIMRYKMPRGKQHSYYKCKGRWVRSFCNFGVGDLHKMMNSKKLFINKIRLEEQPVAYHCLEVWLRNLTKHEKDFDVTWYSEISSRRTFDI